MLKRGVALLAMCLGFLGVIACMSGIYGVWLVGSRLNRANDRAFVAVEGSLAAARDRALGLQQRVQEARLTIDEIGKFVRTWRKAAERLVTRLDIEGKADQLAQKFQQVDVWLEVANASLQGAQRVLEAVDSIGPAPDGALMQELLEKLASVRGTVQEAQTAVGEIRALVAKLDDAASSEERTARILRLAARVVVTIGELDIRLGEVAQRLSELQAGAGPLKDSTSNYITGGTMVGYLLLAWMAAGQAALCMYGWTNRRRSQEQVRSPSQTSDG